MKLDRLLSITMALLGSPKRVSASELAERFEVSLRTVYRDIDTLNQAGIPVISYPGPDGGYEIMPSYRIDKQVLTLDQLVSIYTAVQGIQTATDNAGMTELLERIGALLPEFSTHPSSFGLDFGQASNRNVKERIRLLELAVRESRLAQFEYMDNEGRETHRTIEPMGLYLKRSTWYVWGYCRVRSALRVFRVSRMTSLELLPERFERRSLTIEDVDKDRRHLKPPEALEAELCFQPAAKARVRDEFEEDRTTVNTDGTIRTSAHYYTKEQAIQHIISFGVHVKILGPPELVQAFRDHVLRISQLYGP